MMEIDSDRTTLTLTHATPRGPPALDDGANALGRVRLPSSRCRPHQSGCLLDGTTRLGTLCATKWKLGTLPVVSSVELRSSSKDSVRGVIRIASNPRYTLCSCPRAMRSAAFGGQRHWGFLGCGCSGEDQRTQRKSKACEQDGPAKGNHQCRRHKGADKENDTSHIQLLCCFPVPSIRITGLA